MKKINHILVLVLLAMTLLTPKTFAVSGTGDDGETSTSSSSGDDSVSSDDSTNSDQEVEVETEAESSRRKGRIDKLKTELKIKLGTAERAKIALKCEGAQTVIKTRKSVNQRADEARNKVYTRLTTRLESLVANLKSKEIDTTTLEATITELKSKVTLYSTAQSAFQQSLQDLSLLECKTDPEGFKAALETVRTNQQSVFKSAQDIKTYLKDTLKPELVKLKESETTRDNQ